MMITDRIRVRRDALTAQLDHAQQQHTELQSLMHQLEHSISAMTGGVQELDALLAEDPAGDAALLDTLLQEESCAALC